MKFTQNLKKYRLKIFYLLILICLFTVFAILASLNYIIKKDLPTGNYYSQPIPFTPESYPTLQTKEAPILSAKGALVIDRDSLVSLYEKNPALRFSPASTTKIMTALVALDYFEPDDILTIYDAGVEGASINLSKNEKLTFENLLFAMMLPSANDAAKAIADNYPGGEKAFVREMNRKAKDLGLKATHFEDPIGLTDQKDYTTPSDLARLASIAMNNSKFREVVKTKNRTITNTNGKVYDLENLNILLDIPEVNGVKTGFTEEAGQVLVTSIKVAGTDKELIIVVMQSEDRFGDTQTLLNFLRNNVTYLSIRP
jgi:serine-type D-Ala-D-Ala carboxypeptidase (penicillin-binding protein 5/6)